MDNPLSVILDSLFTKFTVPSLHNLRVHHAVNCSYPPNLKMISTEVVAISNVNILSRSSVSRAEAFQIDALQDSVY